MPGRGFDFVVEFELKFFVVFDVFDRGEDGFVPVSGVFEPLFRRQHGIISASGFRRHQSANLFFVRQSEVVLQDPPVAIVRVKNIVSVFT